MAAHHHDLAARVPLRLEKDRVHPGFRGHAGGERLEILRTANLGSVGANTSVVRHVLRLEGRDSFPSAREPSAERSGEERLACVATAAEDHDRLLRHAIT